VRIFSPENFASVQRKAANFLWRLIVNYNDQSERQVGTKFNVPVAFVIGETRTNSTNIGPNPTGTVPTLGAGRLGRDLSSAGNKPKSLLEKLGKVSDSFEDFKEIRDRQAIYGYLGAVFDLVMEIVG
jgi:hypothetical protein